MPAKFGNRAPGPHTAEDSCQVPPFVGPFANTAAFSVMLLPASGASLRASKRTAPNSDKGTSSEARLRTPRLVGSLSPGPLHRAPVSAAGPVQAKPDPGKLFAPRTSHAHEPLSGRQPEARRTPRHTTPLPAMQSATVPPLPTGCSAIVSAGRREASPGCRTAQVLAGLHVHALPHCYVPRSTSV